MVKFFWLGLVCWAFAPGCSYLKKRAFNTYLKQFQDKKADSVHFNKLPSSYKRQNHPALDALWWNDSLKTSISYFSSCSDLPKSLETFQTSTYPPKYNRIQFSKTKDSLYSILELSQAQKDKVYMAIYTTQRKQCYFNVNLVANTFSSFKKEEPLFKKFIKSLNYK